MMEEPSTRKIVRVVDGQSEQSERKVVTEYPLRLRVNDRDLANALRITEDEWKSLGSIKLPAAVSKDGYVQLLITIRAIS